jgi:hypothetical protein
MHSNACTCTHTSVRTPPPSARRLCAAYLALAQSLSRSVAQSPTHLLTHLLTYSPLTHSLTSLLTGEASCSSLSRCSWSEAKKDICSSAARVGVPLMSRNWLFWFVRKQEEFGGDDGIGTDGDKRRESNDDDDDDDDDDGGGGGGGSGGSSGSSGSGGSGSDDDGSDETRSQTATTKATASYCHDEGRQ